MFSRGNATSGEPICSGMMHVGEAGEQRRREQQQHDRAVHGEQLVVLLVAHELQARLRQLGPHDQRHEAAERKKTNEVIRYRWPMTLWSVDVSQLRRPDPRPCAVRRRSAGRRARDSSEMAVTARSQTSELADRSRSILGLASRPSPWKSIRLWSTPHSSAHRPAYVAGLGRGDLELVVLPGMTSLLNRNAGTQNEWMTSCELQVELAPSCPRAAPAAACPGVYGASAGCADDAVDRLAV